MKMPTAGEKQDGMWCNRMFLKMEKVSNYCCGIRYHTHININMNIELVLGASLEIKYATMTTNGNLREFSPSSGSVLCLEVKKRK